MNTEEIEKYYKILFYIQQNLSLEKLESIYDSNMALHLWDKFIYYDRNLLHFINYLDKENYNIFFESAFLFSM